MRHLILPKVFWSWEEQIYYGGTVLSDYPISAWVGEDMIGDETSAAHSPNEISYKQYTALNMNNLFGKDHYPLDINEGDMIKYIIVYLEPNRYLVQGQEILLHPLGV